MKTRISVQERLKDLRVERGLNLEELAQETGISKSALGSYENDNDEYKEINHAVDDQYRHQRHRRERGPDRADRPRRGKDRAPYGAGPARR